MSKLLLETYALTRNNFITRVQDIQPEIADIQPSGFNNNVHWMIGHVLTVADQFMFGCSTKSTYLPENYIELFGNGTKPADWTGNIPTVSELIKQLKEQGKQIQEIPAELFDEKLAVPFRHFQTLGMLTGLAIYHEAHHLGQIHAMVRLIEARK